VRPFLEEKHSRRRDARPRFRPNLHWIARPQCSQATIAHRQNRDGDHSTMRRFGTSFWGMEDSHER
jgi:hypothetical protein